MSTVVGLTALLVAVPGFAADAGGNYAVWGIGQASCNQFAKAYDAATITDYKNYLSGYLTAYNTVTAGVYQATLGNTLSDNLKTVYSYCGAHRMDSFERAIQSLLTQVNDEQRSDHEQSLRWGRPPEPVEAP